MLPLGRPVYRRLGVLQDGPASWRIVTLGFDNRILEQGSRSHPSVDSASRAGKWNSVETGLPFDPRVCVGDSAPADGAA